MVPHDILIIMQASMDFSHSGHLAPDSVEYTREESLIN